MRSIIEFAYPHGLSVPACYMAASRRALSYSARLPFDLHYGWLIVVVYMVPNTYDHSSNSYYVHMHRQRGFYGEPGEPTRSKLWYVAHISFTSCGIMSYYAIPLLSKSIAFAYGWEQVLKGCLHKRAWEGLHNHWTEYRLLQSHTLFSY